MAPEQRATCQLLRRRRAFAHEPESVPAAREFAMDTLIRWRISDRRDDVHLCVSELATNALVHGGDVVSGFLVTISTVGDVLRVEVRDAGAGMPKPRMPENTCTAGRGLFLVAECADDWGVEKAGRAKSVWAEFKGVPVRQTKQLTC